MGTCVNKNNSFAGNARAIAAAVVASAVLLAAAADSAQAAGFTIKGRGYGHGIGLSQYGAQGYAEQGKRAKWIVRHYYRGVEIGEAPSRRIRVLITGGSGSYSFSGARRACGKTIDPASTYVASLAGGATKVTRGGSTIANCGSQAKVAAKGGVKLAGHGTYRGKTIFKAAGSALNVINNVDLDGYLRGVVPKESIPSWNPAALEAQAIVARSYALATSVNGDGYDVYDDTRSQVYGGKTAEYPSTNAAVKATSGQVALYDGKVATTYFFSTSGGRTESIEHAWPGASPVPYLKSVRDAGDSISPVHRWSESISKAELGSRLGSWVKGNFRNVKITKQGDSPRVVTAKIVGSAGSTRVTGPDIRTRLGLRSTWFHFKRS